MMGGYRASGVVFGALAGLAVVVLACLAFIMMLDVEMKYRLASVAGLVGFAALAAHPERRVICLALWVLIHPLGIEKIFYIDASEGVQFTDPTIAINVSDGPLVLLALFLFAETMFSNRVAFRWSRLSTIQLMFLLWSLVSYLVHAYFFQDGFLVKGHTALLQSVRMLVFVLLVQSAIRTRGDLILILLAVGLAVVLQTLFVGMSYGFGQVFSYGATKYDEGIATLQGFDSSGGGQLLRATGTFGQVNEQATFHAFMTVPLIAFFAVRNGLVRFVSLGIVAGSSLALILTFSRGAWMALPVGLAVSGMLAFHYRLIQRTAILIGATLAVGAAIALFFLAQPIYERLAHGDTGATASRLRMLAVATDLFQSYPIFGVGPGAYAEATLQLFPTEFKENEWVEPGQKLPYPSPTIGRIEIEEIRIGTFLLRRPLPVHNRYLLILSEVGLPGLFLFLLFYAAFIRFGWRCSRSLDRFICLLGIAGLGIAAAQMSYMLVEHFSVDKVLQVVMFVPALIAAAARVVDQAPARSSAALPAPLMGQGLAERSEPFPSRLG